MRLTLGRPVPNGSRITEKDLEFKGHTLKQLIRWHKQNLLFKDFLEEWKKQNTEL